MLCALKGRPYPRPQVFRISLQRTAPADQPARVGSSLPWTFHLLLFRSEDQLTNLATNGTGRIEVIAFLLLCIGVQITWNGAEPMLTDMFKS